MGNGVSSDQGNLPTHDKRDVSPPVDEEQYDWSQLAEKPETNSLLSTEKPYNNNNNNNNNLIYKVSYAMVATLEVLGHGGQNSLATCIGLHDKFIHRVSKKLCQLIFCSFSVKYEPISIKIGRIVPDQTLNETVPKLPTSPKVCACTTLGNLKCQIEPSTQ